MRNKSRLKRKIKKFYPLYIMMFPGFLYLAINNYVPMAGIVIAFKKYSARKGMWGSDWAGLANFEYLFKGDVGIIIRNTLLYNIAFIVINLIFCVAVAIIISDIANRRAKKLYQSAILLPYLVSVVVISYVVYAFLATDDGMINNLLIHMGKTPVQWYSEPKYWPFILCFVNLWKSLGFGCLIYMAGIAGIDPSFYEAAKLDGAAKWKQIRHITLPALVPSIITLLLLNIGRIFNSDFGLFYQVPQNSGALYEVTSTIDTYVYRALISAGGIGRSSAACVFQSVVGFSLVFLCNQIINRVSKENAVF